MTAGIAGDRLRSPGGADRHGVLRRRRGDDDIEDTRPERLGGQPRRLDEQRTALRLAEHRDDLAVGDTATREVRSERFDVPPLGHRSALLVRSALQLFDEQIVDVVGRFDVEQMAGLRDHHEPRVRNQIGERKRIGDGSLAVELADHAQRGSGDVGQHRAAVVGDEAIDRAAQRAARHTSHRIALAGQRIGRDVWTGNRGQDVAGEVGRLSSGIERSHPGSAPLVGLRAVEPERRTGRQQGQAEQPLRVSRCDVLGDHPAERDSGEVHLRRADHVDEVDDGVGKCREGDLAVERGRVAVAGLIPRDDPAAVGETAQLRLPRQPASAESMEQHQRRSGARLAPGESLAVDVDGVLTVPSLSCSVIFVNSVDIGRSGIQNHPMTVDRDELVDRVRAMGPVIAERAVRYDREASFPFENFADFRRARPAGAVRSHRARRARRQLRRLRACQRGDRPVLRRHGPHVQHAQRDDAVVRTGCRFADHVGRRAGRARADQDQHVPRRGRARAHPQPAVQRRARARRDERVLRRVRGRSTVDGG